VLDAGCVVDSAILGLTYPTYICQVTEEDSVARSWITKVRVSEAMWELG
jgi:hypothetical protein